MTVHIKWPLFAADTPKHLQKNNNLRVTCSVWCLHVIFNRVLKMPRPVLCNSETLGQLFDTIEADLDSTIFAL